MKNIKQNNNLFRLALLPYVSCQSEKGPFNVNVLLARNFKKGHFEIFGNL